MDLGMYRWRVKIQQSINNTWSWCWGDSAWKFKHFSHVWLFMKKYLFRTHWCFPGCLYSLDLLHLCHNGTAIFFWQILCWLVFHRVLQLVWFLPQHLHHVIQCWNLQSFKEFLETYYALLSFQWGAGAGWKASWQPGEDQWSWRQGDDMKYPVICIVLCTYYILTCAY